MKNSNNYFEGKIIKLSTVIFWLLFWLLNVVDKFIDGTAFLWVGKDRSAQFANYFSSIGIENTIVVSGFLIFVTIAEIVALVLVGSALWHLIRKNEQKAHSFFFWGTIAGLVIFTFFTVGDQIFGDRTELWEHTTFWMALIMSWGVFVFFPNKEKV